MITSGGGFSTHYPQPSWQTAAVNSYFSKLTASQVPSPGYNRNGRGIPDISLIGVNYEFITAGALTYRYGTSCSAPVFAAMVSLLNSYLFSKNLPPIGFLNPTLYSNKTKSIFNDITSGDNKCCSYIGSIPSDARCCNSGFQATSGDLNYVFSNKIYTVL